MVAQIVIAVHRKAQRINCLCLIQPLAAKIRWTYTCYPAWSVVPCDRYTQSSP